MKNYKHSILMVCYNQEEYIAESIESAINQTFSPFEIVILDDCSKDSTWEIVKQYQLKYPKLIRGFRNETNLGIFKNMRKVRKYAKGDVINFLSGDDLLKPATLEHVNKGIIEAGLDPKIDKFIIVLNSIHLYPDGRETIWNNYDERNIDPIKLRLRYGLSYRGIGMSKPLVEIVPTEDEVLELHPEFGLSPDWIKGFEEIINADKLYFVNYAGPVYRLGSGITTTTTTTVKNTRISVKEHLEVVKYIQKNYKLLWDKDDNKYIKGLIQWDQYTLSPSIGNFLKAFYFWIINFNNFNSNFPWIRMFKVFLPKRSQVFFKYTIYPIFQKIRGRMSI